MVKNTVNTRWIILAIIYLSMALLSLRDQIRVDEWE